MGASPTVNEVLVDNIPTFTMKLLNTCIKHHKKAEQMLMLWNEKNDRLALWTGFCPIICMIKSSMCMIDYLMNVLSIINTFSAYQVNMENVLLHRHDDMLLDDSITQSVTQTWDVNTPSCCDQCARVTSRPRRAEGDLAVTDSRCCYLQATSTRSEHRLMA